ncbi:hypothetical protein B0H19DRAFT_1382946 [Mycena capillaripes]|nr:hypothetical protein B0H19DRAFT_1382946 [Mycena capillaripes]
MPPTAPLLPPDPAPSHPRLPPPSSALHGRFNATPILPLTAPTASCLIWGPHLTSHRPHRLLPDLGPTCRLPRRFCHLIPPLRAPASRRPPAPSTTGLTLRQSYLPPPPPPPARFGARVPPTAPLSPPDPAPSRPRLPPPSSALHGRFNATPILPPTAPTASCPIWCPRAAYRAAFTTRSRPFAPPPLAALQRPPRPV